MSSKLKQMLSRHAFLTGFLGLGMAGCGSGNRIPFESYRVRISPAESLFPGLREEYNLQPFARRPLCVCASDGTVSAFLRTRVGEFLILNQMSRTDVISKAILFPNPANTNINLYIPENPGLHPLFLVGASPERIYIEENPNDPTRPSPINATKKHVGSLTLEGEPAFNGLREIDIDRKVSRARRFDFFSLSETNMRTLTNTGGVAIWEYPSEAIQNVFNSVLLSPDDESYFYAYRIIDDSTCGNVITYESVSNNESNGLNVKSRVEIESDLDQNTGETYSGYANFERNSAGYFYAGRGIVGGSVRNDQMIRRYSPEGKLLSRIVAPGPEYFCIGPDGSLYGGVWWALSRPV